MRIIVNVIAVTPLSHIKLKQPVLAMYLAQAIHRKYVVPVQRLPDVKSQRASSSPSTKIYHITVLGMFIYLR